MQESSQQPLQELDLPYKRVQRGYGAGSQAEDAEEAAEERRFAIKRCAWRALYFLVGAGVALLITLLIWKYQPGHSDHHGSVWHASDYEENFQYYSNPNIPAHPIEIEDNMRLSRLGSPVLAPNGLVVVFTRTQFDQHNLNRSATSLWFYNLPYTDGYSALPLTRPVWGVHDSAPNFDSFSRIVLFLSNRVNGQPNSVGALSQIFQVSVPFPSSIDSIPVVPVTYIGSAFNAIRGWIAGTEPQQQQQQQPATLSAKRRAFQQRLRANTPSDSLDSRGADATYEHADLSDGRSLPTPSQSTYTEPSLLLSTAMSVDNLLIGRNADSMRTILAFSSRVFPGASMAETAKRIAAKQAAGGNSHVYDRLFVRHWDEWMDGTRNHVHFVAFDQNLKGAIVHVSAPVDVMRDVDSDAPTRPDGSADTEWSFSSSAINFAFVRATWDQYSNATWTDNTDVYTVRINATAFVSGPFLPSDISAPVCRTCDNLAIDTAPVYSPIDDEAFVYLATSVPGYESARRSIRAYLNHSLSIDLTPDWSYSVASATWTASGLGLYVGVPVHGREQVMLLDVRADNDSLVLTTGTNSDIVVSPDGSYLLYTASSYEAPQSINIVYTNASGINGGVVDMTSGFNEVPLSKMQRVPTEEFTFTGALGESVQSWLFRPANFDASKTYPLAFLIHGGPQNAWSDSWSYRWNPQMWASAGYFVVMVNFHGSDSFGQAFTDSIAGHYGTLPYEDLMSGLAYLLEESPYASNIDPERLSAAGASYGGFMINWIAGHNFNQTYKFKVLVCHDGIFDTRSFYYSTEELWFPEHDMASDTEARPALPWVQPDNYEQFNPARPDLIANWNTPMLVIHGGLDYRIDESQGLGAFTALQRRGVPSKFLYFPNEAHQVMNPKNQIEWHKQVLSWVGKWTNTTYPPPHAQHADRPADEL